MLSFARVVMARTANGVMSPKEIGLEKFKKIVTNGEGEMPAFNDLAPQHLEALAAFIANPGAAGPATGGGGGGGGMERLPPPPGLTRYFGTYENRILSDMGLPVISPPWTTLTAIDLNEGIIRWQVPLGVVPGLAAQGIRNTGSVKVTLAANRNGPVVTAGGLVFVATWPDRTVHAYDKDTGKLLWEQELEANPEDWPRSTKPEGVSTLSSARLDVHRRVRRPRAMPGRRARRQLRVITPSHYRKQAESNELSDPGKTCVCQCRSLWHRRSNGRSADARGRERHRWR